MSAALENLETWEHTQALRLATGSQTHLLNEIRKCLRKHRVQFCRCLICQGVHVPAEHLDLRNHPEVGKQIVDTL